MIFSASANTQPATIAANVMAMIRSSRDIGPMAASSLRAAAGASGVAPTPGGKSFATSSGNIPMAARARVEEDVSAMARDELPSETPADIGVALAQR